MTAPISSEADQTPAPSEAVMQILTELVHPAKSPTYPGQRAKRAKEAATRIEALILEARIDEVHDFEIGDEEHIAFRYKLNRLVELEAALKDGGKQAPATTERDV